MVQKTPNPATIVETFYLLDLDRCLVDTERLFAVFVEVATAHGSIAADEITSANRDMKLLGDSFDTAGFVRDRLVRAGKQAEWSGIAAVFIARASREDMLLPGGHELLARLQARDVAFGILTYGNPLWQDMKLRASGLHAIPHLITEIKQKGSVIQSWRQGDSFALPDVLGGYCAGSVALVDDKAVSFGGFPSAPSRGFWVLDDSVPPLRSQEGSVPSNVQRYASLADVLTVII